MKRIEPLRNRSIRLSRSIVGESEADAIREVLCVDGYLGMGNEARAFEKEIATYLNIPDEWVICGLSVCSDRFAPDLRK